MQTAPVCRFITSILIRESRVPVRVLDVHYTLRVSFLRRVVIGVNQSFVIDKAAERPFRE
jgi:hypothetical protein